MTHISKEDSMALARKSGASIEQWLTYPPKPFQIHMTPEQCEALCNAAIEHYLSKRVPLSKEQASELWEQHKIELWGGKFGINPIVFTLLVEQAHGIGRKLKDSIK